jgi:hypothetical protein
MSGADCGIQRALGDERFVLGPAESQANSN